jgi:hypothetical protein
MANTQGSVLVTLGKRILGFNTSSSGCCAAPGASAATHKEGTDTGATPTSCCSSAPATAPADRSA